MEPELEAPDKHTAELARLEKQVQEHLDGWKRAKADYLNLKKQAEKEKQELAQYAQIGAVMQFLPVYDSLRRAWEHVPDESKTQEWVKGFSHIQRQFDEIFKQLGLTAIAPEPGQTFDPTRHHAISKAKDSGQTSGTIANTLKLGWQIGDKVMEPAQVTVAE